MPCVTYYSDSEVRYHQQRLDDKDIQELLDEITKLEGETWFVRKDEYTKKRFFRNPITVVVYELLVDIGGEWQIIDFPPDIKGGWSINHSTGRAMVITYLMAYVGGWRAAERRLSRSEKL